jgi:hypothetical protein
VIQEVDGVILRITTPRDAFKIISVGKPGAFERMIDRSGTNPVINHQRFIPGGSITGYPHQVVP